MGFVVVGLDGSGTSRAAFREAIREAQWREASLLALHVVAYPVAAGAEFGAVIDIQMLQESGEQFAAAEIDKLRAEYNGEFPVDVSYKVVFGHSGAQIIDAASDTDGQKAELVVLGSRGLGGFRGLLVGSVTTYAVHHLTCQLLIVPSSDDE